jgi:hypothetical protein
MPGGRGDALFRSARLPTQGPSAFYPSSSAENTLWKHKKPFLSIPSDVSPLLPARACTEEIQLYVAGSTPHVTYDTQQIKEHQPACFYHGDDWKHGAQVCRLLSVVCCPLSAVCCLLSDVYCLLLPQ